MSDRPIQLVDLSDNKVADLDVRLVDGTYRGTINLDATPAEMKALFQEYEELVESQIFNLADKVEQKIAMTDLCSISASGLIQLVTELRVYPSTGRVSFKIWEPQLDRFTLKSAIGLTRLVIQFLVAALLVMFLARMVHLIRA